MRCYSKLKVLLWLCALSVCGMASAASNLTPATSTAGRMEMTKFDQFGAVRLMKPRGAIKGIAILASGDGRWDDPLMQRMAQLLVDAGSAVIGIDTVTYLHSVGERGDQCVYLPADFEDLAHAMEKQLGVQRYMAPVLVGYSSGASLVYTVLAQAPRGMFQAGMSMGFCAEMALQASLCSGRGAINKAIKQAEGPASLLLPLRQLSANWVVLQGEQDDICRVDDARKFSAQVTAAQLRALPKVGHFYEGTRDWRDAFVNAYQGLQPQPVATLPPEVSDLPVTEVPAKRAGDELAILLTGDGGWAELDQELARDLSTSGVSVVALSSLQYFWQARTPQQAARDLSRLMAHYSQVWQRPKIRLLGYSFGADVLPAIINALPEADRASINSVGLLSLLPRTSFEIHVAGWLGKVVGEQAVRPEVEKLAAAGLPVTCVYGREDEDSLCRELPAHVAQVVVLPGGHACNDDHAAIVRAWLNKRAPTVLQSTGRPLSNNQPAAPSQRL
ncbi:MAG: AcvB/VirJ family lysyl-phosphatidylglycerol hydrolase [Steroidobacteraceae bacterium]